MTILHSTIRIVVAAALLAALVSSVFGSSVSANAQSGGNLSFYNGEIARANSIAIADKEVQNYIAGRPYSLMSYGASTNDNEPGVVRPVLIYNIDNKDQLSVTVDLQSDTVKSLLYHPDMMMIKIAPTPGTGNSVSASNFGFVIIAVIAGIIAAAAVSIAVIYSRSKRKHNFSTKTNPS